MNSEEDKADDLTNSKVLWRGLKFFLALNYDICFVIHSLQIKMYLIRSKT